MSSVVSPSHALFFHGSSLLSSACYVGYWGSDTRRVFCRVSLACLVLSWFLITFKLLLLRFSSVGVIVGDDDDDDDDCE